MLTSLCGAVFLCGLSSIAPAQQPANEALALRRQTFEKAWQVVNDGFFDPKFKGVDWKGAHDRYAPRVDLAKGDEEFYALLNAMLGELHESHLAIFPPWMYSDRDYQESAPGSRGGAQALRRSVHRCAGPVTEGVVGMTVHVVEGSAVVTRVGKDSAADLAGVRPGYVVIQIGNVNLQEYSRGLAPVCKTVAERDRALGEKANGLLCGWEGTTVTVRVLDENDEIRDVGLTYRHPPGAACSFGESPTEYALCKSGLLPGSIGYVSFNLFEMPILDDIKRALTSFVGQKAMIIDLRGNPGGLSLVADYIAGRLVKRALDMGRDIDRTQVQEEIARPREPRFDGPVAILMDDESACASEQLAVSLQIAKRAVVVGQRSCGALADGCIVRLPDNSRLEYPRSQYRTSKGDVIEGVGVAPDILVKLTRRDLLAGKDPILDAAIEVLARKMPEPTRRR